MDVHLDCRNRIDRLTEYLDDPFCVSFPKHYEGLETLLETHTLSHSRSQMITLTSLVVQGVPEKYPNLDFVFLEAGVGWVPYMMARLNTNYSKRRSEAPLLEKQPEEYLRERFYFSAHPSASSSPIPII